MRETNLTPAEYGRLLFGFVDRRPALSALYFNERGTALKKRLEYVLNFKEDNVKRSRWQLAIPILIGLAIVPFSIREAYTQDEGGLEVMELVEDEKKPRTYTRATDHAACICAMLIVVKFSNMTRSK